MLNNNTLTQHQDPLGVYRVGDCKFYSKLQAIEMHEKTGIHPHWDFNEAVFSSYNWTKEPETDIRELYRQRAQQIRDQYDYVILMFSGGADSTNMLYSFLDNNIKIDEVTCYINYEATGDKDTFLNTEIVRVALPLLEHLKTEHPWLKQRIIDISQLTVDFFSSNTNKFSWIYEMNSLFNPNNACRESLPLKIKEWSDIIHQGKKLCVVYANDKPRVIHHPDGRFSFRFIDILDNAATVKSIAGQQPYTDELFYWTPDKPEILIKQAHMIKNYLSRPNLETLDFVSTKRSDLAFRQIGDIKYWLSNHGVHTIIYPKWDISTYSVGKISSNIFTERDTWFFNLDNNTPIKQNWWLGIEKLWDTIPDYWKNDPSDLKKGFVNCWSKDYYLN
jgi:hypothetical protein